MFSYRPESVLPEEDLHLFVSVRFQAHSHRLQPVDTKRRDA